MHVTNDLSVPRPRSPSRSGSLAPDVINDRLRHAVFALSEAQGRTKAELHRAMHMSRSALHTRRTGVRQFHAAELAQLAALFGVSADALLAGDVAVWLTAHAVHWRCGDVEGSRDLDSVLTSMAINGLQLPAPRTVDNDTDAAS